MTMIPVSPSMKLIRQIQAANLVDAFNDLVQALLGG